MTDRRGFLGGCAALAAGFAGCRMPFSWPRRKIAINPATIRGYGLSLKDQVEAAVEAGFTGFEPWLKDVHAARARGEFEDAVKIARDGGVEFINGIAFGPWAHPDAGIRAVAMEETKRDMEALAEMGCPCIAASMFGVHKPGSPELTADEIARRYGKLCELGDEMGVKPLLEYWGGSVNMNRLEDTLDVLDKVPRKDTAVLADVYHTFRGGGSFSSYSRLCPGMLPVLHVNDYLTDIPREKQTDANRVWPGVGAAPWEEIFARLDTAGLDPWLSIELFNPLYWRTTPEETMAEGFRRVKELEKRKGA
ncbi:MAG: sugar phosphate isomerase/epimerase [Kiritimatiellae bacterium]|nr:sugar phosphate isomerase/epimerase [Kiritimatiellia bacterium]